MFAQGTLPAENVSALYFPASDTGYAAGINGAVLKTTDAGITWTTQNSTTTNDLYHVFFKSSLLGWACGDSGTILKTTDGGIQWTLETTGVSSSLKSVFFISDTVGYSVGQAGQVLKTADGGNSWTSVQTGISGVDWSTVYFLNANQGYVAGADSVSGKLYKTTDGGLSWSLKTSAVSGTLEFTDKHTSLIAPGIGSVLKTTDPGNTWLHISNNQLGNSLYLWVPAQGNLLQIEEL